MANSVEDIEYLTRGMLCIQLVIRPSMLSIMHNDEKDRSYIGLPRDGQELYKEILHIQKTKSKDFSTFKKNEIPIILPCSKDTDSEQFDPGIIKFFIQHGTNLPKPNNGWKDPRPWPKDPKGVRRDCRSFACVEAVKKRNELYHPKKIKLTASEFANLWSELEQIVTELGYLSKHKDLMESLKTGSLDAHLNLQVKYLKEVIEDVDERQKKHSAEISENKKEIDVLKKEFERLNALNIAEGSRVLDSAIEILCKEIGDSWKDLADKLGTDQSVIDNADMQQSNEEKMKFVLKNDKKTFWDPLKNALESCQKTNITEKIRTETLITEGLKDASNNLKEHYRRTLSNYKIKSPFSNTNRPLTAIYKFEHSYVDLAILDKWVGREEYISDLDYQKKTSYLKKKYIKLEEIFERNNDFVITRGVAGVGKTMLCTSYTLKWTNGEILNGNGNHLIDFLFTLRCQELNETTDQDDIEQVLKELFPGVFDYVSLKNLNELSNRVMFLIDGLDELKDIHLINTRQENSSSMLKHVLKIIKTSTFLPSHKTLVAGRPDACAAVWNNMTKTNIDIKCVEVCGFDKENINKYIEGYFRDNSDDKVELVKGKLEDSQNLRLMANIPIYLWVICGLYRNDNDIEAPKTITELFTYACLFFVRGHTALDNANDQSHLPLGDLIDKNPKLLDIIYQLALLSKTALEKRKPIFNETMVRELKSIIPLQNTGFIYEYQDGQKKTQYQFKHLVLQEFFTSLALFLKPGLIMNELKKECFKPCLSIVAGLCGIKESISNLEDVEPNPIQHFLKEFINRFYYSQRFWNKFIFNLSCLRKQLLPKHMESQLLLKMQTAPNKSIKIDENCAHHLSILFEYQGELSEDFRGKIKDRDLEIVNLIHQIDIRNMIYFILKAEITKIKKVNLETKDGRNLPDNVLEVVYKYYNALEETERSCWLQGISSEDKVMKISTHANGGLVLEIGCLDNVTKNLEFFQGMLSKTIINKIHFHSSLAHSYKNLKDIALKNDFGEGDIEIIVETTLEDLHEMKIHDFEIRIDAKLRFPVKSAQNTITIHGGSSLNASYKESNKLLNAKIPYSEEVDEFCKILSEYINLGIIEKVIIELSAYSIYKCIKDCLQKIEGFSFSNLSINKRKIQHGDINVMGMEHLRLEIESYFPIETLLLNQKCEQNNELKFSKGKTPRKLTLKIEENVENNIIDYHLRFTTKEQFDDIFKEIQNLLCLFKKIVFIKDGFEESLLIHIKDSLPHETIFSINEA